MVVPIIPPFPQDLCIWCGFGCAGNYSFASNSSSFGMLGIHSYLVSSIKGWLRDINISASTAGRIPADRKSDEQCTDVTSIDIGIGHDD